MVNRTCVHLAVLFCAVGLVGMLMWSPPYVLDQVIFYWLNAQLNQLWGAPWLTITAIATMVVVWLIPLGIVRSDRLLVWLSAGLLSAATIYFLKGSMGSLPRPVAVLPMGSFFIWGEPFSLSSFPSGHTASAFMLALWAQDVWPRWRGWLISGAFLVGLSRIACGVHWLSDIVAGAFVACLSFYLADLGFRWLIKKEITIKPAANIAIQSVLVASSLWYLAFAPNQIESNWARGYLVLALLFAVYLWLTKRRPAVLDRS